MEYDKQKYIRKILINYTNIQLISNKNKNKNFLINSKTLEELEKKNMRSKEFFIIEKPYVFQNVNNNRSIIQNTYVNYKSFSSNIVLHPLSERIFNDQKMKNIEDIHNNNLNNAYIDDNSNNEPEIIFKEPKKMYSRKQNESPVAHSKLIKKELGERKLKILNKNKIKKNKEEKDNKNLKNEIGINKGSTRQLSTETLATEISRIIEVVHNEKNINSFGLIHTNSKIEENSEIKKAKIYAKKLKYYCRKLKNKSPIDEVIIKLKPLNLIDINVKKHKISKSNNIDNYENIQEIKKFGKGKKRKLIFNHKIKINYHKKHSEIIKVEDRILDDNKNTIKYRLSAKKLRSERNIQSKIKKNDFLLSEENYNNNERNINNDFNYKTIDIDSKNENTINSNYSKSKKKLKKILKTKTNIIKSPIKNKKKEILPNILIKKIKNKLDKIKRDKKNQNTYNDNSQKIESPFLKVFNKRASINIGMMKIGERLERNFLDFEKTSSSEEYTTNNNINEQNKIDSYKKKRHLKKEKNKTFIYNQNTSKNLEDIKKIFKTKILFEKKQKDNLNLSKILNNNKRKSSPINKEKEEGIIINNTIDATTNKKRIKKNFKKNNL